MTERALVSVIVPVLNEETQIVGLLDHLAQLGGNLEVIIVDAGSCDRTCELARDHPLRPRILTAPRGRAGQCNAGAAAATGTALMFLHADTRLPPSAYESVAGALADARLVGGNFQLRFDGADTFSRVLGAWYALQRRAGIYYGDSTIWLRREVFVELGGFTALPIMEDYDLVRRLERAGTTTCLPGPAVTSARRWQRLGLARTIASWVLIRWLYLAGAPPAYLARLYPNVR